MITVERPVDASADAMLDLLPSRRLQYLLLEIIDDSRHVSCTDAVGSCPEQALTFED